MRPVHVAGGASCCYLSDGGISRGQALVQGSAGVAMIGLDAEVGEHLGGGRHLVTAADGVLPGAGDDPVERRGVGLASSSAMCVVSQSSRPAARAASRASTIDAAMPL